MDWYGEDDLSSHTDGNEEGARHFLHKSPEVRIVVGITCSLSIVGSLFIILSYICFKDLRSKARLILVHISIMDCGVGLANLIGASVYFDHFYTRNTDCLGNVTIDPERYLYCQPEHYIQYLCVIQAFFATYFTLGSVMWTISLSLYLYFLIVHHGTDKAKFCLIFSTIFSYTMPFLITLWLLLTDRLGFSPFDSAGWCGNIYNHPETGHRDVFAVVFSYDLWIYLTIFLVPILSISVHFYIRGELKKTQHYFNSERYHEALHRVDYKFLLIPVVFLILRIWTCLMSILFLYSPHRSFRGFPAGAGLVLMNLSGIGDSGQGLANAILFVLFTKKVRKKFARCLCGKLRKKKVVRAVGERQWLLNNAPEAVQARETGVSQSIEREQTPPENSTGQYHR